MIDKRIWKYIKLLILEKIYARHNSPCKEFIAAPITETFERVLQSSSYLRAAVSREWCTKTLS